MGVGEEKDRESGGSERLRGQDRRAAGTAEKAGTLVGGPEEPRQRKKERGKTSAWALAPLLQCWKLKIGCTVRGRQNESCRLKREEGEELGPQRTAPSGLSQDERQTGEAASPPQAGALASASHAWSGLEGCVPCRGGLPGGPPPSSRAQGLGIHGWQGGNYSPTMQMRKLRLRESRDRPSGSQPPSRGLGHREDTRWDPRFGP